MEKGDIMKLVNESSIYKAITKDKEAELNNIKRNLVSGGMIDLKPLLLYKFEEIRKTRSGKLTELALNEVMNGNIIVFSAKDRAANMPSYMPFIKFKTSTGSKIAVDLTTHVRVTTGENGDVADIESNKLYAFIISAYLYLRVFEKDVVLPNKLAKASAIMWGKLFCKILEAKVALATNKERHEAFMYYSMMFFLINIVEYNPASSKDMVKSYFRPGMTNSIIAAVDSYLESSGIDLYESFETFCKVMFDPNVTGLRTMRLKKSNDVITLEFFMRQYITMYNKTAILSLASYQYFVWMIISAKVGCFIFNDRVLKPIVDSNEYNVMMTEIYKML